MNLESLAREVVRDYRDNNKGGSITSFCRGQWQVIAKHHSDAPSFDSLLAAVRREVRKAGQQ